MRARHLLLTKAIAGLLAAHGAAAQGKGSSVTPVYRLDRRTMPQVEAVTYETRHEVSHIFEVPEREAVGTNSVENGISIVHLGEGQARYRVVRKNFIPDVNRGDMVFLPQFSADTIGYTQTRGFLLFNVKTGAFRDQLMVRLLNLTIKDVAVLDWERRLFLFNFLFLSGLGPPVTELHVMDLSGENPKEVASFEIAEEPRRVALGKTSFYFRKVGEKRVLNALDDRLRPVEHPLLAVYAAAGFKGLASLPAVHPTLPLAVFSADAPPPGDGIDVWAAAWGEDPKKPRMVKLFDGMSGQFRFSPDGKWVLFSDSTGGPDAFMAMAVDPALPQYFGPPVLLRTTEELPREWNGNCAWIADPASVVCLTQRYVTDPRTGGSRLVTKILKWVLPGGRR
jgi:hypothetical protein